jgi:DNA-binding response OmpR family regulator
MADGGESAAQKSGRKVLLVEDDVQLGAALALLLASRGYVVSVCATIAETLAVFEGLYVDVALLDWMLPDGSGTELCREMRRRGFSRPILFLTARSDVNDKVRAFNDGCDDYMVKPIDGRELVARIEAQINSHSRARLFSGNIELSLSDMEVLICGRRIDKPLTVAEMRLLMHFLRHPERVFSRAELLAAVFETPPDRVTNVAAVHMSNLRRKLGPAAQRLETVAGGYRLRVT